jgi:Zn-dependent protease
MWIVGLVICAGWIFSLCLHEFSHALVAYWGGDTSVKSKGYLTFNPLKYTDPGYSIALPLLFLLMGGIGLPGGAVYINHHNLRDRWWQTAVSAAGPTANIFMALMLTIFFWVSAGNSLSLNNQINGDSYFLNAIAFLIYLQVFSAIFNLLPIPGLDGYGIIEPWLSGHVRYQMNTVRKYSTLIIFALFLYAPWFSSNIFKIVELVTNNFLHVPDAFIGEGSSMFKQPINKLITLVILLTFGWSLNPQAKRSTQKAKNTESRKFSFTNQIYPTSQKKESRKFGSPKKKSKVDLTNQAYLEIHKRSMKKGGSSVKERTVINQVHPNTRKRVIVMTGHDMKCIERLLDSARRNNPNRSEQWYWEKILYDMTRDRR